MRSVRCAVVRAVITPLDIMPQETTFFLCADASQELAGTSGATISKPGGLGAVASTMALGGLSAGLRTFEAINDVTDAAFFHSGLGESPSL